MMPLDETYVPRWYHLRASRGVLAGVVAEFTWNADGSAWVSDWTALDRWRRLGTMSDAMRAAVEDVLSRRGTFREVSSAERDSIGRRAALAIRAGTMTAAPLVRLST